MSASPSPPTHARFVLLLAALLGGGGCAGAGVEDDREREPGAGELGTISAALLGAPMIDAVAATNDAQKVTLTLTFTGTHRWFRVYIDTDQRAATGFATRGAGAELLLENGRLLRYAGTGSSWVWTPLSAAVGYLNSGGVVTWTVSRADLGETAPCTEATDLLFDVDDVAAPKLTHRYTPASSCGGAGGAGGASTNDAREVSYQFGYAGAPRYFRVYLDVDQRADTGFGATAGVGADYLLENDGLHAHLGAGWSWSPTLPFGGPASFAAIGGTARWTLPRASIGETRPCGEASVVAFQTEDSVLRTGAAVPVRFVDDPSCPAPPSPDPPAAKIQYVFVIAMENKAAAAIYGSARAPYINSELLPRYARANAFADPLPDGIPSEPHYVWMEAGTNAFADVTFTGDGDPSASNSTRSTAHLVSQMRAANPPVTWLSFQEGMNSATGACPIRSSGFYGAKHNPFVFFQDVAGSPPSATDSYCAAHHRPYTAAEFAQALAQKAVARYNFITPDACHDMHGASGCPGTDVIAAGDQWLRANLPPLIAFVEANEGAIFIVWDEPVGGSVLIPFLAIGPHVKRSYASGVAFTHSSLTKSLEEVFGLPILPTVAAANDLADLFQPGFFP